MVNTLNIECPKCGAKPGEFCKTKNGKLASIMHHPRAFFYVKSK